MQEKAKDLTSRVFFLDPFTKKICEEVSQAVFKLFKISLSLYEVAQMFTSPPRGEGGHWALPCFVLSRHLKKNPQTLAALLASHFKSSVCFEKTVSRGPYINFFFKKKFIKTYLLDYFRTGKIFNVPQKNTGTYLIEYSQPNTHKELHIGHTRNLCFGLALVTLLKKRGFKVTSCTYPGDVGTHVAKCLWYLKYHNKDPLPTRHKGQWLGRLYTKACEKFDQTSGESEKKTDLTGRGNPLTGILKQLQEKKGEFYELWKTTRQWSCDLMKEVYRWAGVRFDHWYWEQEMDEPSVQWIKQLYQDGKLQKSKGALGIPLDENLGFLLLLKSDGNGLYATKDMYLAVKKFSDHNPEKSIYIVDQRQEGYFRQVFKGLKTLGFARAGEKSFHLKYNFVELKTGAMSSRAGNIVPVMTLIDNMTSHVTSSFLSKYRGQWTESQIKEAAHKIVQGAVKYGMNEQDLNKKIVFDMKEWLKWDGKSGPYLQYAYARACTLLDKLQNNQAATKKGEACSFSEALSSEEEWDLVVHLSWFSLVVEKCAFQMKTSPLCHYLFELAQKFSRFYQNCPVATLENQEKKNFRLFLVHVVKEALQEGLSLLAIPVLKQM